MKNSGFKRPTYEEAITKKIASDEKRRNQPKSQAAKVGAARTRERTEENDKLEWEWKLNVRYLHNYRCQYPGCKVQDTHIPCHHVAPRSQRKDLIYVVSNGKCLCEEHHNWVHDNPVEAIQKGLLSNRSRELAAKEDTLGEF